MAFKRHGLTLVVIELAKKVSRPDLQYPKHADVVTFGISNC
jgi:hypothetical protein